MDNHVSGVIDAIGGNAANCWGDRGGVQEGAVGATGALDAAHEEDDVSSVGCGRGSVADDVSVVQCQDSAGLAGDGDFSL